MSHTVTVTRTTTTSTSTAILVNTGFLKTTPGFLKFLETIIAAVCLFLAFFFDYDRAYNVRAASFEFFICVMTAALVASGCILIASLLSLSTASILAKTFFELIYHSVAFGLTLACSITFFFDANNRWNNNKILAGPILGLILSVLYLISSVFAFRGYRGL